MEKNVYTIKQILDESNDRLKILVIASGHAISIFKDWIFDSNLKYALPLNKKSLYFCATHTLDVEIIGIDNFDDYKIVEYAEFTVPRTVLKKNAK